MGTTTPRQFNLDYPSSGRRALELACMGDDELREALLSRALLAELKRFIENCSCTALETFDHNEFHEQFDLFSAYCSAKTDDWNAAWSEKADAPF